MYCVRGMELSLFKEKINNKFIYELIFNYEKEITSTETYDFISKVDINSGAQNFD